MVIRENKSIRRYERRRAIGQSNRRKSNVIEPLLSGGEAVGLSPIVERRRVEGPHCAELGAVSDCRKTSWSNAHSWLGCTGCRSRRRGRWSGGTPNGKECECGK